MNARDNPFKVRDAFRDFGKCGFESWMADDIFHCIQSTKQQLSIENAAEE